VSLRDSYAVLTVTSVIEVREKPRYWIEYTIMLQGTFIPLELTIRKSDRLEVMSYERWGNVRELLLRILVEMKR
jgi:hypothetical protein